MKKRGKKLKKNVKILIKLVFLSTYHIKSI